MSIRKADHDPHLVERLPPSLGILLMASITILLAALIGTSVLV